MDMGSLSGLKAKDMRASGKIICTMEQVFLSGQTESATGASMKTIRKVVKALCLGRVESAKQEYGEMESMFRNKLIERPTFICLKIIK